MKIKILQDAFVWLYTFSIAMILGATVYQMFVITPEFTRDFPNGMIALSKGPVIPGKFWASPVMSLSGLVIPLLAIVLNWKTPRRKWLLLAFGIGMSASLYTGFYFIPRLEVMGLLGKPITTDMALLRVTVDQWITHDYIRFFLLGVPGFACLLKAASVNPAKVKRATTEDETYNVALAV